MNNILHICPSYLQTDLYHNMIIELENYNKKNIVYVPSHAAEKNVSYKVDFLNKSFGILDRLFYFRKQKILFKDILKKDYLQDISVIHAHTLFSAGYAAYRISKLSNKKYIVAVRDTDVNVFFKYMIHLRAIGVDVLNNAEHIVFLSNTYKNTVLSKYIPKKIKKDIEKKSVVIPNGIAFYFLKNKYYRKININDKLLKILFVGEINRRKNILTTIKACKFLINMGYNISYTIVGEEKNKHVMNCLKKCSFVSYYSKCGKEQVLKYMRDADLFVMPSITETFGLVYPEAMSQGLPVIYSKGQGFDGNFKDGDVGFAVDCFDYKMIAKRILDIYSDYNNISERCTKYVDRFNWEKIALEYKEIFDKII